MRNSKGINTETMKTVRNTEKTMSLPEFLARDMATGGHAIEHQEAQGQKELVNSDVLPRKLRYVTQEQLQSLGFEFLGEVPDDELFQYVKLPEGWMKKSTNHSMWSILVDEKGRERASIFYKAAFYDRDAFLNMTQRFMVTSEYRGDSPHDQSCFIVVKDSGKVIKDFGERENLFDASKMDTAKKWLSENYPEHENVTAYWD